MKDTLNVRFFPLPFEKRGDLWICGNITLRKDSHWNGSEDWVSDIDDGWLRKFIAHTPEQALIRLRHYLMTYENPRRVINYGNQTHLEPVKYYTSKLSEDAKKAKNLISKLKTPYSDLPLEAGQFRLLPIIETMDVCDFMYSWVFLNAQPTFQDLWKVAQEAEEREEGREDEENNKDADTHDYYEYGMMFFEWLIEEMERRGVSTPGQVITGKAPFQTTGFCPKRLERELYNLAASSGWLAPKVNMEESYE